MRILVDRMTPAAVTACQLDVAIIMDVLRATSTATVLISRGVESLPIIARPDDLAALPPPQTGPYLIFSELSAAMPFERVDNSPVIASTIELAGRTPVLLTTNGTTATCRAVAHSRQVLLASFLNARSVARYLLETGPERVTLIPAGSIEKAESHIEDDRCADAIDQLLRGEEPDFDRIAAECLASPRVQRRLNKSSELAADIHMSLTPNGFDVLIEATPGPAGSAFSIARRLVR